MPTTMSVMYLSRICKPQKSSAAIFPTHTKSNPRPVRRKLVSLTANASIKTSTASIPHETVIKPVFIFRASMKRSEEHTSELQSRLHLVCRLLLEKKKKQYHRVHHVVYR